MFLQRRCQVLNFDGRGGGGGQLTVVNKIRKTTIHSCNCKCLYVKSRISHRSHDLGTVTVFRLLGLGLGFGLGKGLRLRLE